MVYVPDGCPLVVQSKVALLLNSWATVHPPPVGCNQNRYCGAVQPMALAVKVIVVPIGCGELGFAPTLSPLHEGPDSIEYRVLVEASVPDPPKAWASTQMV